MFLLNEAVENANEVLSPLIGEGVLVRFNFL